MPYKPRQLIQVLKQIGFVKIRQKGSHQILDHPDGRRVVVPLNNKTLAMGIFNSMLGDAGLSLGQFRKLL